MIMSWAASWSAVGGTLPCWMGVVPREVSDPGRSSMPKRSARSSPSSLSLRGPGLCTMSLAPLDLGGDPAGVVAAVAAHDGVGLLVATGGTGGDERAAGAELLVVEARLVVGQAEAVERAEQAAGARAQGGAAERCGEQAAADDRPDAGDEQGDGGDAEAAEQAARDGAGRGALGGALGPLLHAVRGRVVAHGEAEVLLRP